MFRIGDSRKIETGYIIGTVAMLLYTYLITAFEVETYLYRVILGFAFLGAALIIDKSIKSRSGEETEEKD